MVEDRTSLVEVACPLCGEAGGSRRGTVHALRDAFLPGLGMPVASSRWAVCTGCGVVHQNPRPNPTAIDAFYAGGFYHSMNVEKFSEAFLSAKRAMVLRQLSWAEAHMAAAPPSVRRSLDVGCGAGVAVDVLRGKGWEAHGVEPDGALAAFGDKTFGLSLCAALFVEGLYPAAHFGFVYNHHVYEHLSDPLALTRALRKAVAPDAWLFFAVPTYKKSFHFFPWEWMNVCHNTIFTHVTFERMLLMSGFCMVDHRYDPYGELWVLARPSPGGAAPRALPRESWPRVQLELWAAPLLFGAGLAHRVARRLVRDPAYFFRRLSGAPPAAPPNERRRS